jgi:hypothetical protein
MTERSAQMLIPIRGPSRLRLVIKPRSVPPRPYAWEIYDDEHDKLVLQSEQRFRTFKDAWAAGTTELEKLRSHSFPLPSLT